MISQEKIQEAIQKLVQVYTPQKIYIFGPYAWGKPSDDDDLDILVVIDQSQEKLFKRTMPGHRALYDLEAPKDIIVYTNDEFDRYSRDVTTLCHKIEAEGLLMYARS